jgi:hypothetical protein
MNRQVSLYFLDTGHAELLDENEQLLWTSDADADFLDDLGADTVDPETDEDFIFDYLVEQRILSRREADHADVLTPNEDDDEDEDVEEELEP